MLKKNKGNALPIVLVLMLVLTVMGVSGLKMAQAHYRMAGIEQFQIVATEAAEAALAYHFLENTFTPRASGASVDGTPVTFGAGVNGSPRDIYFGSGPVPAGGASMANNTFKAYHFEMRANGTAPANTSVEVVQGMYLIARGQN